MKRLICIILSLGVLVSLSGCGRKAELIEAFTDTTTAVGLSADAVYSDMNPDMYSQYSDTTTTVYTTESTTVYTTVPTTVPTTYTTTTTLPPTTVTTTVAPTTQGTADYYYNPSSYSLTVPYVKPTGGNPNEVPVLSDLVSLSNYLNRQKDSDIFNCSFRYVGSESLSAEMLAQMTNAYYIYYSWTGDKYDVTITEFPGDRIVDAWRSGNTSTLSSDELQALNTAISMVNQAKAQAKDDYELELLLHDMLVDRITYFDDVRTVANANEIIRNLTVIGALLDGKANCQGYTDAFYTLGSIAGFKVARMSVETSDDLHMTNTICLNGIWYIIDVTFDDQDSGGVTNYRLFNAGTDVLREYGWKTYKQVNPITPVSDSMFYYNHYGLVYTDKKSMARAMADKWINGEKVVRGMVKYEQDGESIDGILYDVLNSTGRTFNYTYWYFYNDRDTYFTVRFN